MTPHPKHGRCWRKTGRHGRQDGHPLRDTSPRRTGPAVRAQRRAAADTYQYETDALRLTLVQ